MTKSAIKICNFFHYFLKEGGYPDCDQFSLSLFSLSMRGGRVLREIVPNSLYPLFIFFEGFPYFTNERYSNITCLTRVCEEYDVEKTSQDQQPATLLIIHMQGISHQLSVKDPSVLIV